MTSAQDELIRHFLAGVQPLIEAALAEQKPSITAMLRAGLADGCVRLELVAIMGHGGAVRLELRALLPGGDDLRLVTVQR